MVKLEELPVEILEQCFGHFLVDPMPEACCEYFVQRHDDPLWPEKCNAHFRDEDDRQSLRTLAALCLVSKDISQLAGQLLAQCRTSCACPVVQSHWTSETPFMELYRQWLQRLDNRLYGVIWGNDPADAVLMCFLHCSLVCDGMAYPLVDINHFGTFSALRSVDIFFSDKCTPGLITELGTYLAGHNLIDRASFGVVAGSHERLLCILRDVVPRMSALKHLRLFFPNPYYLGFREAGPGYVPTSRLILQTLQVDDGYLVSAAVKAFMKAGLLPGSLHTFCWDACNLEKSSSGRHGPILEDLPSHLLRDPQHLRLRHLGQLPYGPNILAQSCQDLRILSLHTRCQEHRSYYSPPDYAIPEALRTLNIHGPDLYLIQYLNRELESNPERFPHLMQINIYAEDCEDWETSEGTKEALQSGIVQLRDAIEHRGGVLQPANAWEQLYVVLEKVDRIVQIRELMRGP